MSDRAPTSSAVPTLLLTPGARDQDAGALALAAIDAGWSVERLTRWRLGERRPPADSTVLYGGPFVEVAAAALDVALLAPPPLWEARLPFELLRRELRFTTVPNVEGLSTADAAARLRDGADLDQLDDAPLARVRRDTFARLAPAGPPLAWERTAACFLLDGALVAASASARPGELAPDEGAPLDAEELADLARFVATVRAHPDVALPPAFVLHVGRAADIGWVVSGASPVYSAELHDCDPAAVLPVLARASRPRAALSPADAEWVVPLV